MDPSRIDAELAMLSPDDLWPAWRYVDLLERAGEVSADEALRWKNGIYDLLLRSRLEVDALLDPVV